jgi:serine/threonine protein phosphatase PrpC
VFILSLYHNLIMTAINNYNGDRLEGEVLGRYNEVSFRTIASDAHPAHNKDRLIIDEEKNLYGVFGGVSSERGANAAELASNLIEKYFKEKDSEGIDISAALAEALIEANNMMIRSGLEISTTALLARIENDVCHYAYAGISRLYLIRDGYLSHITLDHNIANMQRIKENHSKEEVLEIQATLAARPIKEAKVPIYALGRNNAIVSAGSFPVQQRDRIILMTNGVNALLDDRKIRNVVNSSADSEVADNIINLALNTQHDPKNIRGTDRRGDMSLIAISVGPSNLKPKSAIRGFNKDNELEVIAQEKGISSTAEANSLIEYEIAISKMAAKRVIDPTTAQQILRAIGLYKNQSIGSVELSRAVTRKGGLRENLAKVLDNLYNIEVSRADMHKRGENPNEHIWGMDQFVSMLPSIVQEKVLAVLKGGIPVTSLNHVKTRATLLKLASYLNPEA